MLQRIEIDDQVLLRRKVWLVLVWARDRFTCCRCSSQEDLCAHHKDGDETNHRLYNGETLCRSCHMKHHTARGDTWTGFTPEAQAKAQAAKAAKTPEERSDAIRRGWETRRRNAALRA